MTSLLCIHSARGVLRISMILTSVGLTAETARQRQCHTSCQRASAAARGVWGSVPVQVGHSERRTFAGRPRGSVGDLIVCGASARGMPISKTSEWRLRHANTRKQLAKIVPRRLGLSLGANVLSRCLRAQLAAEAERASPPHPSGGDAHEAVSRLRRATTPEDDEALGGPLTSECSDLPPCIASASSLC